MVGSKHIIFFIVAFLLLAGVSCNKDSAKNDADVLPDGDKPAADDVINLDQDTISTTDDQSDISNDSDSVESDAILSEDDIVNADTENGPDVDWEYCVVDENPDADIEYIPNTHTGNEDCPALASAKFPYYDTDGTLHFCRKCDQVRKNDLQCMKNMYAEDNINLCNKKPQYDCYDYPCDMPWLEPMTASDYNFDGKHICDISLSAKNPKGWTIGTNQFKHFNVSQGKIGFYFDNAMIGTEFENNIKAMEYSLQTQEYRVAMAPQGSALTYNNGNFLLSLSDPNVTKRDYLAYIRQDGFRSIVFNHPVRIVLYNPALNDNWAFVVIEVNEGDPNQMFYAKVGEWKWQSIGEGVANEPFIVGNRLVFYDSTFQGVFCDLDKAPKSVADCKVINRENEKIRTPVPDQTNGNHIYFENAEVRDRLYRVDLSTTPWTYEELPVQEVEPTTFMMPITFVKDGMMLYRNNFSIPELSGVNDSKLCYYRVDEKKSYCMKPVTHYDSQGQPTDIKYNHGYAEFDGKYLVWQLFKSMETLIRDMDCYCQKEGVCPFEGTK